LRWAPEHPDRRRARSRRRRFEIDRLQKASPPRLRRSGAGSYPSPGARGPGALRNVTSPREGVSSSAPFSSSGAKISSSLFSSAKSPTQRSRTCDFYVPLAPSTYRPEPSPSPARRRPTLKRRARTKVNLLLLTSDSANRFHLGRNGVSGGARARRDGR
jgi:hypothetical protein